jgi:hypothetical protein
MEVIELHRTWRSIGDVAAELLGGLTARRLREKPAVREGAPEVGRGEESAGRKSRSALMTASPGNRATR